MTEGKRGDSSLILKCEAILVTRCTSQHLEIFSVSQLEVVMQPTSSKERPGMLLSVLQHTDHAPTAKNSHTQSASNV